MKALFATREAFNFQSQPVPVPTGRDVLVEIKAVSVNPVDVKVRASLKPEEERVLGWDAAGIVTAVGPEASKFSPGDDVFYAGALRRQGSQAGFQVVDENLVAKKPTTLNWAEAAALPLTALTAWEMLFQRFGLKFKTDAQPETPVLLVIGGAGGVGSVAIQLAKTVAGAVVIATASRPETEAWVRAMGADGVITHARPLGAQIEALGLPGPGYVFSTSHTKEHLPDIVGLIQPAGHIGLIDDPDVLDVVSLKQKSLALHWEWMFTPSFYKTPDCAKQGEILAHIARLVDEGHLRTTLHTHMGAITPENLSRAHALLESGASIGKIVLEGF